MINGIPQDDNPTRESSMNLTKFSDYSLRMLLYLALHPGRPVPIAEISRAYNVSPHVLVKASQLLIDHGAGRQRAGTPRRAAPGQGSSGH